MEGLFKELCCCEWYIREHEAVNLFVFGHLVHLFEQYPQLDITQIGIEVPVLQVDPRQEKKKYGARKDVVIWSKGKMTPFKGVDVSTLSRCLIDLRAPGQKPFAVMEWKHISRFTECPEGRCDPVDLHPKSPKCPCKHTLCAHERDKEWLRENLKGNMLRVGYAVLIDHKTHPAVTLKCHRLTNTSEKEFLVLPHVG